MVIVCLWNACCVLWYDMALRCVARVIDCLFCCTCNMSLLHVASCDIALLCVVVSHVICCMIWHGCTRVVCVCSGIACCICILHDLALLCTCGVLHV